MARNRSAKKGKVSRGRAVGCLAAIIVALLVCGVAYHYRSALAYYFSFKTESMSEEDKIHILRNYQVMSRHENRGVFGFDVSEYQGKVNWFLADSVDSRFPIDFVFIRATAGNDVVDKMFADNWAGAKKQGLIRGAYHYYRPNENSLEQAENFIRTVKLATGDLPPVLDIEKLPEEQSVDSLKVGLKRWLKVVEKHYKVKPIIYSGDSYYNDFLKEEFSEYIFWIANYNFFVEKIDDCWMFWQFTERAMIPGVEGPVDINIFNGKKESLQKMGKK